MVRGLVVLLAVVLFSVAARAGPFWSGQELYDNLKHVRLVDEKRGGNAYSAGAALGFVLGVVDASELEFCLPSGVRAGQLVAIVEKYLNANPEQWTAPANVLVRDAVAKAFPCRYGPPPSQSTK